MQSWLQYVAVLLVDCTYCIKSLGFLYFVFAVLDVCGVTLVSYRQYAYLNSRHLHTYLMSYRKRISQNRRQRLSLLVRGTELLQFLAALEILRQDDLKKWMNRRMDTWRHGCSGIMHDHPVRPNQTTTLPKWMFFQKLFSKSSLLLNN